MESWMISLGIAVTAIIGSAYVTRYMVAEAKGYLQDTDYKVLPDYDGNTDGVLEARAEARALIRGLEG